MLNIKIICVGKIKETSLKELCDEYLKRLTKYCKIEIIELEDEKLPQTLNNSDISRIKEIHNIYYIRYFRKIFIRRFC